MKWRLGIKAFVFSLFFRFINTITLMLILANKLPPVKIDLFSVATRSISVFFRLYSQEKKKFSFYCGRRYYGHYYCVLHATKAGNIFFCLWNFAVIHTGEQNYSVSEKYEILLNTFNENN